MAEDFKDPRDVAWHPRRRHALHGHQAAEQRLMRAVASGKLHHAWLIEGPRGIGKATLAYRFARYLALPEAERPYGTLAVPQSSTAAHQLAAGAHPNIHVLERGADPKAKRLKTEIAVDDSREAIGFLLRTSATGGWRIVIADAADELNGASANALLKMIEEPPPRSVILMVCHQPGRLLRTIRSRSIRLPLASLSREDTLRVLRELPPEALGGKLEGIELVAELSRGSPGRALELHGSKGAAIFAGLAARERLTPSACSEIAANFSFRSPASDYKVFCELLEGWVMERARDMALGGKGGALAAGASDIVSSLRQADALNLDRRQTVTDALMRLEEALKAS